MLSLFSLLYLVIVATDAGRPNDAATWNDRAAFAFYRKLDFFHENIVYSQLTNSMALGMILKGAKGKTAVEIKKVLFASEVPDKVIHAQLQKLLNDELHKPRDDVTLTVSNLALFSKDVQVKPEYIQFLRQNYHAFVDSVDFKNDGDAILAKMNAFVSNRTKGLVPNVITKKLDPNTQLAVINTAYMKGLWQTPFPKENTHRAPFYNKDGSVSQVDMMHTVTEVPKCRLPGKNWAIVQIPYKGSVGLNTFIPDDPFGEDAALAKLDSDIVYKCFQNATLVRLNLYMPRFRLDYEPDLKSILTKQGARLMFYPTKADLTGITDSKPFAVSQILSRVILNFNEEGTDAKEADEAVEQSVSPGHAKELDTLRMDHPFTFGIYDDVHSTTVFGNIVNKL